MSKISEAEIRSRVPRVLKDCLREDVARRRRLARMQKSDVTVTESSIIRDILEKHYALPPVHPYGKAS